LPRNIKEKKRIYKMIVLHFVLYGCESCFLTLRQEYRQRVFENKMLRRIFGLDRDKVMQGGRKLLMHLGDLRWDAIDGIEVAQNRDPCKALVNTQSTCRFHKMLGSS
jgi:hypothetical protein